MTDRLTIEFNLPVVAGHQPDHHVETSGLSCAVGAEQTNDFATGHLERDIMDNFPALVALAQVCGAQPANVTHGLLTGGSLGPRLDGHSHPSIGIVRCRGGPGAVDFVDFRARVVTDPTPLNIIDHARAVQSAELRFLRKGRDFLTAIPFDSLPLPLDPALRAGVAALTQGRGSTGRNRILGPVTLFAKDDPIGADQQ